jgi:hypothetical protein
MTFIVAGRRSKRSRRSGRTTGERAKSRYWSDWVASTESVASTGGPAPRKGTRKTDSACRCGSSSAWSSSISSCVSSSDACCSSLTMRTLPRVLVVQTRRRPDVRLAFGRRRPVAVKTGSDARAAALRCSGPNRTAFKPVRRPSSLACRLRTQSMILTVSQIETTRLREVAPGSTQGPSQSPCSARRSYSAHPEADERSESSAELATTGGGRA